MLADEIDDRPASLALRDVLEIQPRQLPPPQTAPHQQPEQNPVPQAFPRFRIGLGQQPPGLLEHEPVAGPDAGDPGGGQRGEPAVRGGFRSELAQGGEREVDRGGREPALDEVRAVAPEHRPGKALSGGV